MRGLSKPTGRPTKWDRQIADEVWRLLELHNIRSPKVFIGAVRKDAKTLLEALIEGTQGIFDCPGHGQLDSGILRKDECPSCISEATSDPGEDQP